MKRLTRTSDSGEVAFTFNLYINCLPSEANKILNVATKLKEYEDLEEQGRLLKLPCKVGSMFYYPDKEFNIVTPMRLTEIVITFNGLDTITCQYNCCSFDECGDCFEDYEFDNNDIGKTVFLTKFEAEAKLKELRGEENESSNLHT